MVQDFDLMTEVDDSLARAGIALARARDDAECAQLLCTWARELTRARDAQLVRADVASDASHVPANTDESWHELAVDSSTTLRLRAPRADAWRGTAAMLVRQAAVGFERVRNRAQLALRERQQRALVEAAAALHTETTLDSLLGRVVELAMEMTDARYGAVGVLGRDSERLTQFVTRGLTSEQRAAIGDEPTGRGLLGELITNPVPLRLTDLAAHERSIGFPPNHPPMRSFLGVPIITAGVTAGRIYLTEQQSRGSFNTDDEALVTALAAHAAIAIDNAVLREQLERTVADLAAAHRAKSVFLASMSHELRSPLNTIHGYAQLLLDNTTMLDDEQREDVQLIHASSMHLRRLVDDLLDLQQLELGRLTLAVRRFDLRELLRAVCASVRPEVAEGVALALRDDALHNPDVKGDPTRIRQVILNVLGNALKFTEAGSVEVVAADDHDTRGVVVTVTDTGPGMPLDDQERIFETFYQSRAAARKTPHAREGAGLGLAIARMIVEQHGGDISLTSQPGAGTSVRLWLPRHVRERDGVEDA